MNWGERMNWGEAKAYLLAGEELVDEQGGRWHVWIARRDPQITFARPAPEALEARILLAAAGMRVVDSRTTPCPRVTRIDVKEHADRWSVRYTVPGLSALGHDFESRPTVAEVKRQCEAYFERELDFSEAYMIITEREKPRAALEAPRVTRIDVRQSAEGAWFAEFRASDGSRTVLRFGRARPSVDDVRERLIAEQIGPLDFSGAYLIVEPYVAPKPCQRTWGCTDQAFFRHFLSAADSATVAATAADFAPARGRS